jgi:hypothetical protein
MHSIEHPTGKDLHNRIALSVRETSLKEDTRYLMFKMNFKLENAVTSRKFYNRPKVNSIGKIANHWEVISRDLLLDIRNNVINIPHLITPTIGTLNYFRFQRFVVKH